MADQWSNNFIKSLGPGQNAPPDTLDLDGLDLNLAQDQRLRGPDNWVPWKAIFKASILAESGGKEKGNILSARGEARLLAQILQSCTGTALHMILNCEKGVEAYNLLSKMYERKSGPFAKSCFAQLQHMTLDSAENYRDHVDEFSRMLAYYRALDGAISDQIANYLFVRSVCPAFNSWAHHVQQLQRDKLKIFDHNEMVQNFLSAALGHSVSNLNLNKQQRDKQTNPKATFSRGRESKKNKQSNRDFSKDKRGAECAECRRKGHTRKTCWKIVGVPDWLKDKNKEKMGRSSSTT